MSYWAKTYGPGVAEAVAVDRNGDIIVVGEKEGAGFVARLDKDGNVKWFKTYGENRNSGFNDVKTVENGDIIVVGQTKSFGTGNRDAWVLRLDENGNVKWQKTYGGSNNDEANAVVVAPNGDIIIAGWTKSFGTDGYVWVLRLDENGTVKWQKIYGGKSLDGANAVAVAPNGDIIIAGETESVGTGNRDAWVLRLDENGNVKWQKTYGGSDWDGANAVVIAPNGDVIVAGYTFSFGINWSDFWVIRLDTRGNVKWQKAYGGRDWDMANAVVVAPNGDIIIAGWTKSFGTDGYVWVLRLDENGTVKWQKIYGGKSLDGANAVAVAPNGDIIIAGETESFGNEDSSIWILCIPPDGELEGFSRDSDARVTDTNAEIHNTNIVGVGGRFLEGEDYRYILVAMDGSPLSRVRLLKETSNIGSEKVERELKVVIKGIRETIRNNISLKADDLTERKTSIVELSIRNPWNEKLTLIGKVKFSGGVKPSEFNIEIPAQREEKLLLKLTPKGYGMTKLRLNLDIAGVVEAELDFPLEVQEHPARRSLPEVIDIITPQLVEDTDIPVKITVTNTLADSLKLTFDFSANEFLDLEATTLEFPELRMGQKVSKTLTVTPKYAGSFDFRVKIKAIADGIEVEDEKVIPVEVAEKTAQPYTTPQTPSTPATPSSHPVTPSPAGLQLLAGFPPQLAYKYTDVELIGKGGFARVYKAKRRDGKVVAVKIPLSLDENTGKAFLREITNWLHLKHPNIVHLYDANVLPIPFLEMEYCESSLEKLPKPMKPREAALLIFNIAEGLKYAHSKGIIHRDLKPSNILLKDSTPKISDWGLSKVVTETHTTTTVSYTPHYAAPEQISRRFGRPDHRSDIWQLGVIFYELVTGRRPFEGDSLVEIASRITMDEPVPPSELNPEAREVEPVIMACLEKDMERRYQSAAELQFELATYLGISYKEELKRSLNANNTPRAAFYAGQLMLVFLKMGNLKEAYKYASDLRFYTHGKLTSEVEALAEQIKVRLEEDLSFAGEELLAKAEIIAHKVSLGFREV